jgi:hypothetical protein
MPRAALLSLNCRHVSSRLARSFHALTSSFENKSVSDL